MNQPGLQALLERVTADVAASRTLAEDAWTDARRRSRRAVLTAVASAGAFAVLAVALVAGPLAHESATPPATTQAPTQSATPTLETTPPVGPLDDYADSLQAVIQPAWRDSGLESLPRMQTNLPSRIDPFSGSAPLLSEDPVGKALAVAQRTVGTTVEIRVLGEDQRWRELDTPGLAPSFSDSTVVSLINGEPISPDGTELALPQPHDLVVVDLTSGTSRRIDLPRDGAPDWAGWTTLWSPDGAEIVVGFGVLSAQAGAFRVDVVSGKVERADLQPSSADFGPDGSLTEITNGAGGLGELDENLGEPSRQTVILGVTLAGQRPAVGSAIAVTRLVTAWTGSKSAPINSDGILAVAPEDGAPLAFIPMAAPHQAENSELVGWVDADTLLARVFVPIHNHVGYALIAWDIATDERSLLSAPWTFDDGFDIAFAVDGIEVVE